MAANIAGNDGLRFEELTSQSPDAAVRAGRELLLEYGQFVVAQPNVTCFSLAALQHEAARLPHSYLDSGGGVLLSSVAHRPIGLVAWRALPGAAMASAWELKRLWVRPEARSLGASKALVLAVIERALTAGKTSIVLDTAPAAMPAAHRLYLKMGFIACSPYNGPAAPGIEYLRKQLVSP